MEEALRPHGYRITQRLPWVRHPGAHSSLQRADGIRTGTKQCLSQKVRAIEKWGSCFSRQMSRPLPYTEKTRSCTKFTRRRSTSPSSVQTGGRYAFLGNGAQGIGVGRDALEKRLCHFVTVGAGLEQFFVGGIAQE